MVRKEGETKWNYKQRRTCDRVCQAHFRHGTTHKLKPKPERVPVKGRVPARFPVELRSLFETALEENPEFPYFLLECLQSVPSARRVDTLADYGVR
jgi:hypothetical protein